jgi:DNA polymerase elongation subunit (family B)
VNGVFHLFDVYPVEGGMAVWLLADGGDRLRLVHPWAPRLYYAGDTAALRQAEEMLRTLRIPTTSRLTTRRDLLRGETAVVEVTVADPPAFSRVVARLALLDGFTFYNCDIALPQMYMYEHRLFPLGRCAVDATPDGRIREIAPLESPWDREYTVPPLTVLRLRLEGDPTNPNHGHRATLHVAVDGEESGLMGETPAELLTSLIRWLRRYDPDILLTEWGDSFLLPRLRRLASLCGLPLTLSRDPDAGTRTRRARSYVTYGQIVYTAGGSYLHGRWHLDTTNSFTYEEAELPGLFELARLGRMPVQHAARTSVGTVITSMQLDQAYQDGILIPWRKSRPEAFKSAGDLLVTDRGGLSYAPLVGAYDNVGELDFAAMYPAMMARYNISQETVNCACCRGNPAARVPDSPHHLCRRQRGLIPRVLERVLERRAYYKIRKAEASESERHQYDMRQTALKWIGVVCLDGNTLVPHRVENRWRCAPIREIVDRYLSPDATGNQQVHGLAVIGIDGRLHPCMRSVRKVIKTPAPESMIRVRLKWNRELLVTPDHPCYVLEDGRLEIKRADQLTVGEWIPMATSWEGVVGKSVETIDLIAELNTPHLFRVGTEDRALSLESLLRSPLGCVRIVSIEKASSTDKFVYCFEVDGDPAAFFINGGVLTHNCFGYQGYKNARFGQIEAHECTTALGREMLLRAKEIAEAHGYRMLHALVDSVWLQRPGATRADFEALAAQVRRATDLPIAVEGVYRWIAFVPSRMHPLIGVPNRYFGVFENGTSKVRGIELRRGDTPPIAAAMQTRMLALLFHATTLQDARAQIPAVRDLLEEQLLRLRQHEVHAEELVIRTTLSQDPYAYTHAVPQAVAAHQLVQAGVTLHPGEAIEYIITNAASPVPGDRAVAYARLPGDWSYDAERYALMLSRAMDTLLVPFGERARDPTETRRAGRSRQPAKYTGRRPLGRRPVSDRLVDAT